LIFFRPEWGQLVFWFIVPDFVVLSKLQIGTS
jgi:hypothetical protein